MIVCHCHGVTDREIRASVKCGARTCADVANACGAGSGCGGCEALVEEIVHGERRRLAMISSAEASRSMPSLEAAQQSA
jgi:bacterioferritin-associated ferredoxin